MRNIMPARAPEITAASRIKLQEMGATLKAKRRQLGVGAKVAAQSAGMSRVTLYRVEKGEPSVTMGAYISVARVLGIEIAIADGSTLQYEPLLSLPIRLSEYEELKRISWHVPGREEVSPSEAFEIYERHWRHVEQDAMTPRESALIEALARQYGEGRLLV